MRLVGDDDDGMRLVGDDDGDDGDCVGARECRGVVVREGADLITLDMCGGELGEALPHLSLLSLAASNIRTRVLEARGGKILMVGT